MRITVISLFLLFVFLFSCTKGKEIVPPESEPPIIDTVASTDTTKKQDLVVNSLQVVNAELSVDSENISLVFPGSILTVDSTKNLLKFKQVTGFKALSVIYYSDDVTLPIAPGIVPSSKSLQDYLAAWNNKEHRGTSSSGTYVGWTEFIDNRFLFNFQEESLEFKRFIDLFPKYDITGVSPKQINRLLSRSSAQVVNVAMDHVYGEGELISQEDLAKISQNAKENYLVVSVQYGFDYKLVAESKRATSDMKQVLNKAFQKTELTQSEVDVLNDISIYFYLRTSVQKEVLLKKASGASQISSSIKEFDSTLANLTYAYPVSFILFNLKDFSTFRHTYTNEWFIRKE